MTEQSFVLLIMNCEKYEYKATMQKQTWLKHIPSFIQYYHVIGDEFMDTDYCFDNDKHLLWVKTPDDYNSLPKKVITAYSAINDTMKFDYILKTDDDQNLINPKFFGVVKDILIKNVPKYHYGGNLIDVDQPYLSQYHLIHPELPIHLPILKTKYCSGRFYFLSKSAVTNLINNKDKIMTEFLEDYAIGLCLDASYKENILHINTSKHFEDFEDFDDFEDFYHYEDDYLWVNK